MANSMETIKAAIRKIEIPRCACAVVATSFTKASGYKTKHFVIATVVIAGEVAQLISDLIIINGLHELFCLILTTVDIWMVW
jgi:hypothetical protein